MDDVFKLKGLIVMALFSLAVGSVVYFLSYKSDETKMIFCDVGQGDATYIRISNGKDILIDAGESRAVLDCLGIYMPPTDTYIDVVMISHPHRDHYGGLTYVLDRYRVGLVIFSGYGTDTTSYQGLVKKIEEHDIPILHAEQGMQVHVGMGAILDIVWPTAEVVARRHFAQDANAYSVVCIYREGDFETLFTGDVGPEVIARVQKLQDWAQVDVLKVPHHGSDNGITREFLEKLMPTFSVISVAKQNRYGHPSQSVLDMFKELQLAYALTSEQGHIAIEIHPDGTFSQ